VGLRGALGVLVGHGVVVEAEGGNGGEICGHICAWKYQLFNFSRQFSLSRHLR
jgi:hypothetical protein